MTHRKNSSKGLKTVKKKGILDKIPEEKRKRIKSSHPANQSSGKKKIQLSKSVKKLSSRGSRQDVNNPTKNTSRSIKSARVRYESDYGTTSHTKIPGQDSLTQGHSTARFRIRTKNNPSGLSKIGGRLLSTGCSTSRLHDPNFEIFPPPPIESLIERPRDTTRLMNSIYLQRRLNKEPNDEEP